MSLDESTLVEAHTLVRRPSNGAPARQTRKELESQIAYIRESKADHAYSRAIPRLFDLAMSYVEDAERAARQGRRAAWAMGLWDAPLLYACDTVPISLTELGRMGSIEAVTVAEDYFQLPKETCSMVSSLLGEWYLRRETTVKKMVVFSGSCEPLNLAWELVRGEGYDVYRIEAVNRPFSDEPGRWEMMVSFLTDELAGAAEWLTGGPIDEKRAATEIQRVNRILRKVRRVLDLRLANPLYIRSLATMFLLMGSAHYFGKPEQYEAVLDQLLEELESAPVVPSRTGRVVPLAWIGGRGQEFGVYKAIDDCGGAIVGWQTPNVFTYEWREDVRSSSSHRRVRSEREDDWIAHPSSRIDRRRPQSDWLKGHPILRIRRLLVRRNPRRDSARPFPEERISEY